MDYDNIRKSLRKRTVSIIILVLIVLALGSSTVLLFLDNQRLKEQLNKKIENSSLLTEEEAKEKAIELYDKATEIYEVYSYNIPYCGKKLNDLKTVNKTNFEKELSSMTETAEENSVNESDKETSTENNEKNIYKNETYYYKSKFNNIDGLKDYLSNFLIESRVNEMTKIKPLKNIELLQNETYKDSNYVLHNNKLYCKIIDIKNESRYISNYTNEIKPYEIKTIKIRANKITFLVTSKYLKDEIKDFNTECKDDIDKCIRTDDQSFSIELVDGSWLVSMFNIHE